MEVGPNFGKITHTSAAFGTSRTARPPSVMQGAQRIDY